MPDLFSIVMETIFSVWDWIPEHLIFVNLLLSVGIVFFQRRDPRTVWAWLLALNFIPVFGIIFYLLFCQDYKKNRMFRIKEVEDRLKCPAKLQEDCIKTRDLALLGDLAADYESLVLYNLDTSGSVLTMNNKVQIFADGEEKFQELKADLEQAREYIHMEYYIIKNDEVFDSIAPILIRKAEEGVQVRILADGMGGRFMPGSRWEILRQAGINNCYLEGEMVQGKRNEAIKRLTEGRVNVLVATDVAARGIDIPDVSHVFNFDMPRSGDTYLHRIGRTARAGRKGTAISLVEAHDHLLLGKVGRYIEEPIKARVIDELRPKTRAPSEKQTGKPSKKVLAKRAEKKKVKEKEKPRVKKRHRDTKNIGKRRKPSGTGVPPQTTEE